MEMIEVAPSVTESMGSLLSDHSTHNVIPGLQYQRRVLICRCFSPIWTCERISTIKWPYGLGKSRGSCLYWLSVQTIFSSSPPSCFLRKRNEQNAFKEITRASVQASCFTVSVLIDNYLDLIWISFESKFLVIRLCHYLWDTQMCCVVLISVANLPFWELESKPGAGVITNLYRINKIMRDLAICQGGMPSMYILYISSLKKRALTAAICAHYSLFIWFKQQPIGLIWSSLSSPWVSSLNLKGRDPTIVIGCWEFEVNSVFT